jgi:hypothetical protein
MENHEETTERAVTPFDLGDCDKGSTEQLEMAIQNSQAVDEREFIKSFTGERSAELYRKIDRRLIPMLALLYLFACESRSTACSGQH